MRRLVFLIMAVTIAVSPCVSADTFDYSAEVLRNVRSELDRSAVVRTGSGSIADICRGRIEWLNGISRSEHGRTVDQTVNMYMQNFHMHLSDFDIVQLRRSGNFEQLEHNANSLATAYKSLLDESKGKGGKVAEYKERGETESGSSRKSIYRRENRQKGTKKGRSSYR